MNKLKIHPSRINCIGCESLDDDNGYMECMNLIFFHGGTPPQPDCYEYPYEIRSKVTRLMLVGSDTDGDTE